MNQDELKARIESAAVLRAALEQSMPTSAPEQRIAIEQQLHALTSALDAATNDLGSTVTPLQEPTPAAVAIDKAPESDMPREVAGFGSADLTPEEAKGEKPTETGVAKGDSEAVREKQTVRTYELVQGARLGALTRRTKVVEVHTHPDIVEARQAVAIAAARDVQRLAQKAQAKAEFKEKADAERKDMNDAARLYEGLPQHRGINREEYAKIERDWNKHLNESPEKRAALSEQAKGDYLDKRNSNSDVPYRAAQPGEAIAGKIVGVKSFEGVKHTVIEKNAPPPERIVVQGEIKGASLGKQVEIQTDAQRRLQVMQDKAPADRITTPTKGR